MTELDDHRELLNAIVETIHGLHNDIDALHRSVDLIRSTQMEHGKALAELSLKVDRAHRPRDTGTPRPITLSKIEGS